MTTVNIFCSLPNGLVFPPLPNTAGQLVVVTLNGANSTVQWVDEVALNPGIIGASFTSIDSTIWANWQAIYGSTIGASGCVWET